MDPKHSIIKGLYCNYTSEPLLSKGKWESSLRHKYYWRKTLVLQSSWVLGPRWHEMENLGSEKFCSLSLRGNVPTLFQVQPLMYPYYTKDISSDYTKNPNSFQECSCTHEAKSDQRRHGEPNTLTLYLIETPFNLLQTELPDQGSSLFAYGNMIYLILHYWTWQVISLFNVPTWKLIYIIIHSGWSLAWKRSGSVVECLTGDRRVAGSSLTGVTALWSLSKTHLS